MNRFTRFSSFLLICNTLALVACTAPSSFEQYQSTIQQFQVATDKTSAVTLEFILDLNNFERRLEIERLRADPERVLDLPNNFIANKFDPKAIATRAQAFDTAHAALVNYAKSEKGVQDVSDLVVAVNRYSALAESLMSTLAKP